MWILPQLYYLQFFGKKLSGGNKIKYRKSDTSKPIMDSFGTNKYMYLNIHNFALLLLTEFAPESILGKYCKSCNIQ